MDKLIDGVFGGAPKQYIRSDVTTTLDDVKNGNTRFRCSGCGRWISYYNITKTFDGCYHCSGEED